MAKHVQSVMESNGIADIVKVIQGAVEDIEFLRESSDGNQDLLWNDERSTGQPPSESFSVSNSTTGFIFHFCCFSRRCLSLSVVPCFIIKVNK